MILKLCLSQNTDAACYHVEISSRQTISLDTHVLWLAIAKKKYLELAKMQLETTHNLKAEAG